VKTDFLAPLVAGGRYGAALRRLDATPEFIESARQDLATAQIAKTIRAAGPLSHDHRIALASLLLDEEAAR